MGASEKALQEFLAEAEDIVEEISQSLLGLESSVQSGKPNPDIINAIFRGAHSLKGLSAMFDFKVLSGFAHKLEDVLDQLRLGKLPFNDALYALLFDCFEKLGSAVRSLGEGKTDEDQDFDAYLGRLRRFVETQDKGDTSDPLRDIGLDGSILNVLSEYEEHRLRENVRAGNSLVKVGLKFSLETFGTGLSEMSEKFKSIGEIVSTLPNASSDSIDDICFDLLLGTSADLDTINSTIEGDYTLELIYQPTAVATPVRDETPSDMDDVVQESLRGISRSVRVDIGKLDHIMNIIGELVLIRSSLERVSSDLKGLPGVGRYQLEIYKQSRSLDRKVRDLQFRMMDVRMVPLRTVFDKLSRAVRRICSEIDKPVRLQIKGADTELDKLLVDELAEPLMHMIRNSMDHGIETAAERKSQGKPEEGTIRLEAYQKGNHVVIEVTDDGRGINLTKVLQKAIDKGWVDEDAELSEEEITAFIFSPGFSTSESVSALSGRGVGMDVVKNNISKMGGVIDVQTKLGEGTTFLITLPITLAIIQALFVEVSAQRFAIPLNAIMESVAIDLEQIQSVEGRDVLHLRNHTLPVFDLGEFYFGHRAIPKADGDRHYVVIISLAERKLGLLVDRLLGQQDVVIKPFAAYQDKLIGFSGATETGDQTPVLVFDVPAVIEQAYATRMGGN